MAIYEIKPDSIAKLAETTFHDAGLKERADLQRLLRMQFDVIAPDVLIVAEEFGEWEDARRRIDLLGIDKDANLVVIELKRIEDGGYMDLQAIRYAAMVSTMTFEKAVEVYRGYLVKVNKEIDAHESLLEFLGWEEPDEDSFAQDVRIILIAADFSKELTTAVMWLNERALDIRCVRIKPYNDDSRVLIDVQQVIPLPEAHDYMVGIREKSEKERIDRAGRGTRQELRREFWKSLLELSKTKTDMFKGISASDDSYIITGAGVSNIYYAYVVRKHDSIVEFVLAGEKDRNKANFDVLFENRQDIEKLFGEEPEWNRCNHLKKSYIRKTFSLSGYRNDRTEWPRIQEAMIDSMIRLEKALSPYISKLRESG